MLDDWFEERSRGFPALTGAASAGLPPEELRLVEDYQMGGLAADLARSRRTGSDTGAVIPLADLVRRRADATGYMVYRGLAASAVPEIGAIHVESTLSSWSLYPSIALNIAFAQGAGSLIVLKDRIGPSDPSLYVDEWEFEILRDRLARPIVSRSTGNVTLGGSAVPVWIIGLGADSPKGNDDGTF